GGPARQPPVAQLGHERGAGAVGTEQPGTGRIVDHVATVMAEADAVGELARVVPVALVVDDAGALPDAQQPRQRDDVRRQVGGPFEHAAQRWPRYRFVRTTTETNAIASDASPSSPTKNSSSATRSIPSLYPANSVDSPKPTPISAMTTIAPRTLAAMRWMN